MSDDTRLIHAGKAPDGALARTVGPPIQKGSTVLLPNAAALYDDDGQLTYGRAGLAAQAALQEALAVLEAAVGVSLYPSGMAAVSGALLAVLCWSPTPATSPSAASATMSSSASASA